jgi:hypothetical protein
MSMRKRIKKLETASENEFKVVVTEGQFFDKNGAPISTEGAYPRNLVENVHRAIVSVSGSEEAETLERKDGETGAEFMRRFEQMGIQIGKKVGATVTLRWDVKWI